MFAPTQLSTDHQLNQRDFLMLFDLPITANYAYLLMPKQSKLDAEIAWKRN